MEPKEYFQYKFPKFYNALNGTIHDFSQQANDEYKHFISAFQDKKLVVLTSETTLNKLQAYYDEKTTGNKKRPLLQLSHTGRWYANGFISAYNYCVQYGKKQPSGKFDFTPYARSLEEINELNSSSEKLERDYILNVGRIEGTRFYLAEHGYSTETPIDAAMQAESVPTVDSSNGETLYNSTGLTLEQNLVPKPSNMRILAAVEKILEEHSAKQSRRSVVGCCIIALRSYFKKEASDVVLIEAFRHDYFPNEALGKFASSVNKILRAYRNGPSYNGNPDEKWGPNKEAMLQDVITKIRKAISGLS